MEMGCGRISFCNWTTDFLWLSGKQSTSNQGLNFMVRKCQMPHWPRVCSALGLLVFWLAVSVPARADVVQLYNGFVGGFQNDGSKVGRVSVSGGSESNLSWGQSFTNNQGQVQITSVTAILSAAAGTTPTGNFQIHLFRAARSGGLAAPTGQALYSTGNIALSSLSFTTTAAQKDISLTGSTAWNLDASISDYMLVFDGSLLTGSNYFFLQDSTTAVSGQNLAVQQDGGAWTSVGGSTPPTSAMVIYANTVPEPGTLALMSAAQLAGFLVWRSSRNKKRCKSVR